MIDLNDAGPQRPDFGSLIPDGTYAQVILRIKPGGYTLPGGEAGDEGLYKAPREPGGAVLLDCEFSLLTGPHQGRKVWQYQTVAGGKMEKGVSVGWNITKSFLLAMVNSALNLHPEATDDATKKLRQIKTLAGFDKCQFFAKIGVEAGNNGFSDKNKIVHVVEPGEPEYQMMVEGHTPETKPSGGRAKPSAGQSAAQNVPAWQRDTPAAPAAPAQQPLWGAAGGGAVSAGAAPAPTLSAQPKADGPSWLHQA